ncbi:hypothetical protein ACQY0O_002252 [Thecaphora frezii]
MPQHVNRPEAQRLRCTRCLHVKDRNQFSRNQLQTFKKNYCGNQRSGADLANISVKCKECAQAAHAELVEHHIKCDVCGTLKPATDAYFGSSSRRLKAASHVCLQCAAFDNIEQMFGSDDEMVPIHEGEDNKAAVGFMPEDLAEEEEKQDVVWHHDEEAEKNARRERTELERISNLRKTVMTVRDRGQVKAVMLKAKQDEQQRLARRKPKFALRLKELQQEAEERRKMDAEAERRRGRVKPAWRNKPSVSDTERDEILAQGNVDVEHIDIKESFARNTFGALPKPKVEEDEEDEDSDGEPKGSVDNVDGAGDPLAELLLRKLTIDGQGPGAGAAASPLEPFVKRQVEKLKQRGQLPSSEALGSTRKWKRYVNAYQARVRIAASERGLAKRCADDQAATVEMEWYGDKASAIEGSAEALEQETALSVAVKEAAISNKTEGDA